MNILISDDCVLEENEVFYTYLMKTPGLDNRIMLSPEFAVITITDHDCKDYELSYRKLHLVFLLCYIALLVGLEQTSYTVLEVDESVEVCAVVDSGCYAAFSFQINFKTFNDSAGIYIY